MAGEKGSAWRKNTRFLSLGIMAKDFFIKEMEWVEVFGVKTLDLIKKCL